jgi:membrane protein
MISVAAFVLMLYIIPATKVHFKSAMIGGMVGGTIWEIAKVLFSYWVTSNITYNALYGSLALIPIFLVWLYLTWIIVLFSVEVSYVHQNFKSLVLNRAFAKISPRDRLHLSLRIFAGIAEAFFRGTRPPNADELADRFVVPPELVEDLLHTLEARNLLVRTEVEQNHDGFVPGRSLDNLTLAEVLGAVYEGNEGGELGNIDEVDRLVRDALRLGEDAAAHAFNRQNFLELLKRTDAQTHTP